MTKDPILPGEELLNELMELNQENERPLPPEQLIRTCRDSSLTGSTNRLRVDGTWAIERSVEVNETI